MLMCQATELKKGLFGQEEFTVTTDGKTKGYIFKQFDVEEFTKTRTITIPEQPKTPLQESVEEIRDWQKENVWEKQIKNIANKCKQISYFSITFGALAVIVLVASIFFAVIGKMGLCDMLMFAFWCIGLPTINSVIDNGGFYKESEV